MSKPLNNKLELGHLPLLVRIGDAERLFGISRHRLMKLLKAGRVRTVRLTPKGHHRFPVYELACCLGMADMVPRLAVPIGRELIRDIDEEVRKAVVEARTAFGHELRSELDKLKGELRTMLSEASAPRPSGPSLQPVQRALKNREPSVRPGGSY